MGAGERAAPSLAEKQIYLKKKKKKRQIYLVHGDKELSENKISGAWDYSLVYRVYVMFCFAVFWEFHYLHLADLTSFIGHYYCYYH